MVKIALTGPESTGKTELSLQLAEHFHAALEPELAREYVENLDRDYTFEDVCDIARLQVEQELKYENIEDENALVVFDTDLIITKVWLDYKFGNVPPFVTKRLSHRFMDLYLLCEPDLPWVPDPVREHGDDRPFFFDWYEREIIQLATPYVKISGTGDDRFVNARQAVEDFILAEKNKKKL